MPYYDDDQIRALAEQAAKTAVERYVAEHGASHLTDDDRRAIRELADDGEQSGDAGAPAELSDEQRFAAQIRNASGGWESVPIAGQPPQRPEPSSGGRAA